ncbi:ATP-binding protein [Bacillus thuringiensis]|uniref:ATP-binding protein n=3 Tax=Bacillus thuringiensis TaxID=1428 RepID=UPI0007C598DA|nr:ATP-binding protein [Bacillus thuringiensis]MEC3597901.1 ATP-binding protein [Bacillus thuringiensis]MED1837305.1 ATP-binding protein [Bacillus thuringiensis]MED2035285.1 ATP-binding protein [Bacillus thuringiensis]MED2209067.1 ATP-binding protein [Bacillus thuringiensis]MED2671744.1 ATP-binding protein [Bacillus thuringiensis]
MFGNKWISELSLRKMTILLVLMSVMVSLIASATLLHSYILRRESNVVNEKLRTIARIVAKDPRVINEVTNDRFSSSIEQYALEVMESTGVSFVVVLNNELIRKSHPEKNVIGKPFSDIDDAKRALNGSEHFSKQVGILGEGTRFFTPILNEKGKQVGIVCVGFVQKTINQELWDAQKNLYMGLGFGLFIGIVGAIYLARKLKEILLGLEPRQIVANIKKRDIIINSVGEGIIAVTPKGKILLQNNNFKKLIKNAKFTEDNIKNGYLDKYIFSTFFAEVFKTGKSISDHLIVVNQFEFIVNVQLIFVDKKIYGAVATLRDQSEMQQLIRELSGTEQYIDSLRAQNHKFMNQLHTILGLIELEKYQDVTRFIYVLNADYQREIGFVTDKIKSPAVAGFLLGKTSELKEQGVKLMIDAESYFPSMKMGEMLHDLLLSMGILLDNAKESMALTVIKQATIFLHYDVEEKVILIEVKDTGIGMDEECMKKIFERGFSTKGKDRGYGLDAVQSIVKQYHGLIDVQSELGKGSIFRVEVPYKRRNIDD